MGIEGIYSGNQFAFVPTEGNYEKSTRMHESAHRFLTQTTAWGQMVVLVKDIMEVDSSLKRVEDYYPSVYNVLISASEFTQESFAVLLALHEAKSRDDSDQIEKILKSDYAKIYNDKYLRVYLSFLPADKAFYLCQILAEFAMDTYLLDAKERYWSSGNDLYELIRSNPALYHPDFRFKKLVNALFDLLPTDINDAIITGVDLDISVSEIIKKAGLYNLHLLEEQKLQIFEAFKKTMSNVFNNEPSFSRILTVLDNRIVHTDLETDLSKINYFEIPLPELNYEFFQFEKEYFPLINKFNALRIFLFEENIQLMYISTQWGKMTICQVYWENVRSFLDAFENEIIVPYVDYQFAKSKLLFPSSRRVFYYIECHHDAFKESLVKSGSEEIPCVHFWKINETTYAIFAKIQENEFLVSLQKTYAYNMFFDDVFNGEYKYIQLDDSLIDGVFYKRAEDHVCYGSVIQAILQIDNAGLRINLKGYETI